MGIFLALYLALFLAVTVKDDQAPLRAGCAADARVVATLPAGTPVTLRYSMAGESVPCYKVAVEVDGKHVDGYLPASSMEGLNSFEQGRRDAAWVSTPATPRVSTADALSAARSSSPLAAEGAAAAVPDRATRILMAQASALIEGNQPAKALALLEPEAQ